MKTVYEEANELAKDTISSMSLNELEGFMKAMGWDEESENAKLPDWYGIKGIKFIWHGEWSDPGIKYKGKEINSYIVEDTMWERWIHDDDDNLIPGRESDLNGFEQFMRDNADEVKELCEYAIGNGEV